MRSVTSPAMGGFLGRNSQTGWMLPARILDRGASGCLNGGEQLGKGLVDDGEGAAKNSGGQPL